MKIYRLSLPNDYEYRRVQKIESYNVTPEWVLHHLAHHEAEHRDKLGWLCQWATANLKN